MVEKKPSLYLFVGEDSNSKDTRIKKLIASLLPPHSVDFDSDNLSARELTLKLFQEKILILPLKAKKRVVIIRQANLLKPQIKEFILKNIKTLSQGVVLIMDVDRLGRQSDALVRIAKFAQVIQLGGKPVLDTFTLSRQIEFRSVDQALRILDQLLKKGERPERIMGGLRYSWERGSSSSIRIRKRLGLLLACDLEIKRGRLKADLALEKLVISLCALGELPRKT